MIPIHIELSKTGVRGRSGGRRVRVGGWGTTATTTKQDTEHGKEEN